MKYSGYLLVRVTWFCQAKCFERVGVLFLILGIQCSRRVMAAKVMMSISNQRQIFFRDFPFQAGHQGFRVITERNEMDSKQNA